MKKPIAYLSVLFVGIVVVCFVCDLVVHNSPSPVYAQPSPKKDDAPLVTLPPTISGQPGIPTPLVAVANGSNVAWVTPDAGLVVIDGSFFEGNSKKALLFAPAGQYRLWAFTAVNSTISPRAECVVTIGTPVPPPPPTPPVPPVPPTPPVDPLTAAIQSAYTSDADSDRAKSLAFLQASYRLMASQVGNQPFKTNNDLAVWMSSIINAPGTAPVPGLTKTQLVNTQKAIAAELMAAFGNSPSTTLDLMAASRELDKIATALGKVK